MTSDLEHWLTQQAVKAAREAPDDPRLLTGTGVQPKVRLWAAFDDSRDGWCVWSEAEGGVIAAFHAGPFATREEAEALLGPPAPGQPHKA